MAEPIVAVALERVAQRRLGEVQIACRERRDTLAVPPLRDRAGARRGVAPAPRGAPRPLRSRPPSRRRAGRGPTGPGGGRTGCSGARSWRERSPPASSGGRERIAERRAGEGHEVGPARRQVRVARLLARARRQASAAASASAGRRSCQRSCARRWRSAAASSPRASTAPRPSSISTAAARSWPAAASAIAASRCARARCSGAGRNPAARSSRRAASANERAAPPSSPSPSCTRPVASRSSSAWGPSPLPVRSTSSSASVKNASASRSPARAAARWPAATRWTTARSSSPARRRCQASASDGGSPPAGTAASSASAMAPWSDARRGGSEAVVDGVAHEGVVEPVARAVLVEEPRLEARVERGDRLVRGEAGHRPHELEVEARAGHRRGGEQRLGARAEPLDAAADRGGGDRGRRACARLALRPHHLLDEERRAVGDPVELRDGVLRRRLAQEVRDLLAGAGEAEPRDAHAAREPGAVEVRERHLDGRPGVDRRPRCRWRRS